MIKNSVSIVTILLMSCASAWSLPSDMITHQPGVAVIDLQSVSPLSAKAIAATNEPLGPYASIDLPKLGRFDQVANEIDQAE